MMTFVSDLRGNELNPVNLTTGEPLSRAVVGLHGVLTENTGPIWPLRLAKFLARHCSNVLTIPLCYWAGPTPLINMTIVNRIAARRLLNTVRILEREKYIIDIISHSNGGHVAALAAPLLLRAGYRIGSMTFVAPAMPSDIRKTPMGKLIDGRSVRRIVTLCSVSDSALAIAEKETQWFGIGYGHPAGIYGLDDRGVRITDASVQNVHLDHLDHSDYWDTDHFESTCRMFCDAAAIPCTEPAALPSVASAGPACSSSHMPVPASSKPKQRVTFAFDERSLTHFESVFGPTIPPHIP